jgi:pyridoxal phosphate enzyme (YggS family)
MEIARQIENIRKKIPSNVKLIAVSKTQSIESILQAYQSGQKSFGENKVQELVQKYELLPKDIEWHMIGHLQTNKVKLIAPFVTMIHSVDSLKLLQVIDSEAGRCNRVINCLLQVKIAREESKFGFNTNELISFLDEGIDHYKNIRFSGIMGMATFTIDETLIRDEFHRCKQIFDNLKLHYFINDAAFIEISMGMSDDYEIAVQEGSTMVRIGSKIFGHRNYTT